MTIINPYQFMAYAAAMGNISMLEWGKKNRFVVEYDAEVMSTAAAEGHIKVKFYMT